MARPGTAPSDSSRSTHSERAQWAWERVNAAKESGPQTARDYATQVRKLPARIQVNGLGQTLAFLYSKNRSDKNKAETGEHLLLCQLGARMAPLIKKDPRDLERPDQIMKALVTMGPDEYRRCTHELMVTAEWLKRFADGLFDKSEE